MNQIWKGPGVMVAWGPKVGQWTPEQLADLCVASGVRSVCYQVIPENDDHGLALHDACRARNLHYGGWTNVAQQITDEAAMDALLLRIQQYGCGFFAANVEERWAYGGTVIDGDLIPGRTANGCHEQFCRRFRQHYPLKPACVQTNFGGFEKRDEAGNVEPGYDRGAQAIYTSRHFDCQHEDYTVDNPRATPVNGDFTAHNQWGLQFPTPTSSLIGVYDGWHIANYRDELIASGRSRVEWVYLAEEMDDADWAVIGKPL